MAVCDRCEQEALATDPEYVRSSVDASLLVCRPCLLDERLRMAHGLAPIAPDEWPVGRARAREGIRSEQAARR